MLKFDSLSLLDNVYRVARTEEEECNAWNACNEESGMRFRFGWSVYVFILL